MKGGINPKVRIICPGGRRGEFYFITVKNVRCKKGE